MPLIKPGRLRSIFKLVAWIIILQLILINISAALYAYKFTHFYDSNEYKVSSQNFLSKTWRIFAGPKFYKSFQQAKLRYPIEDINLQINGLKLHGWYSFVNDSKGCIILLHGIGANKIHVADEGEAFRKMGYNILMIDFRGHGLSEGNTSTFGDDETAEVKAAYDFALAKGNRKIILFGTSLGAVVAIKSVADKMVQPHAIIAEMPFGSLQQHLKSRARVVGFPSQPFAFFVTLWISIERGYNGFSHQTTNYAKKINCPVLLQWGRMDNYVSEKETYSVYDNIPSQKKLVIYNAGHQSLLNADSIKWNTEVTSFLQAIQ